MVEKLVDNMNRALEANCHFAALSIALMLPDICGKAEYPDKKVGERYKLWYDTLYGDSEKPHAQKYNPNQPYLSGDVLYSLRNSFLHQGTPNVEEKYIDQFILVVEKHKEYDMFSALSIAELLTGERIYYVNVSHLCFILGRIALGYYKENKEKFNFFQYSVLDADEYFSRMR